MPPENESSNEAQLAELTGSNVVIVAGKGGVGKTTVTALLARAVADRGRRVLVIELDGKPVLDRLLPDLEVTHIRPSDALAEYLVDHGFKRIAKRLAQTGVIDVVGTAAPGIDDLVVLGKIKQLERSGQWDVIIVDGPAAGHAITFLTSAAGLLDAVRSGPVHDQASDVAAMLADPDRCQVVLVTLPETTPVNELVETAWSIEDRVGVRLGPVIVNQVDASQLDPGELDPGLLDPDASDADRDPLVAAATAAAAFRNERREVQRRELARLAESVPLPQVHLPMRPVAALQPADIAELARPWSAAATSEEAP